MGAVTSSNDDDGRKVGGESLPLKSNAVSATRCAGLGIPQRPLRVPRCNRQAAACSRSSILRYLDDRQLRRRCAGCRLDSPFKIVRLGHADTDELT